MIQFLSIWILGLNNFHQLSNILKHSSRLVKLFVAGNEFQDQVERYKLKSTVVLETESSSFVLPFTTDFKVIYIWNKTFEKTTDSKLIYIWKTTDSKVVYIWNKIFGKFTIGIVQFDTMRVHEFMTQTNHYEWNR